jgi:hypothetical protein
LVFLIASDCDSSLESLMWDYASFSTHLQGLNVEGGVGEPKFRVDGSAFRDGSPSAFFHFNGQSQIRDIE